MNELTPEKLAELRRMLDAATPRPWMACEDEDEVLIVLDDDSNHWPGRDALAAKLDADGLPVVTTVGDLTARHIGRRVRVNGTVRNIISVAHTRDGSTVLHLQPGSRSDVCLETASVTPCEVLP